MRGPPVAAHRFRYAAGLSPTSPDNFAENEPRLEKPTGMHTSVTVRFAERSRSCARSMRRRVRYRIGVSPYAARNARTRWNLDRCTRAASPPRVSGSA